MKIRISATNELTVILNGTYTPPPRFPTTTDIRHNLGLGNVK